MRQDKKVVFIGGIHGAGKTSLCERLEKEIQCRRVKQRNVLIQVGNKYGLDWPDIGLCHDQFIDEVAEKIAKDFGQGSAKLLLIDCHYAIRADMALRARNKNVQDIYIYNIDLRVVKRMTNDFLTQFVLLLVDPVIALGRLEKRPIEPGHYENNIESLAEEQQAETELFYKIINDLGIPEADVLVLTNNDDFESALGNLRNFILLW